MTIFDRRRPRSKQPVALTDFRAPKTFAFRDVSDWKRIAEWQASGLISVTPVTPQSAKIALTDKGIAELARGQG